jgi:hypothetical protein
VYHSDDIFNYDEEDVPADRSEFIQLSDIRRIEKEIEAESVRFHSDDGLSTLQWVKQLEAKGHLLGFKAKSDPPPPGSGLDADVFTLMLQTNWQRTMFQKYGSALLCIDATHNTTMYNNLNLTTLVVRDKWAHGLCSRRLLSDAFLIVHSGIPVAFMLASSGKQTTIGYFLRLHRARNPLTIPRRFISDFDWPQINAIIAEYQSFVAQYPVFILLCWWHVLHAWQQHFHIPSHPELWDILKAWIRVTDLNEFKATWAKIKTIAPTEFVKYLDQYWMSDQVVRMWSAVYRKDRTIFENCDTNMLIEACVRSLPRRFALTHRSLAGITSSKESFSTANGTGGSTIF